MAIIECLVTVAVVTPKLFVHSRHGSPHRLREVRRPRYVTVVDCRAGQPRVTGAISVATNLGGGDKLRLLSTHRTVGDII